MLWSADPGRFQRLVVLVAPLILPLVVLPVFGKEASDVWSVPAWSLLGVVLLAPPRLVVTSRARLWAVCALFGLPLAALLLSPAVAYVKDRYAERPRTAAVRPLADLVARKWETISTAPLAYVGGDYDLANGLTFYERDAPTPAAFADPAMVQRRGIAIVCLVGDNVCNDEMDNVVGHRRDVLRFRSHVEERFWGATHRSPEFTFALLPPLRPPAD